MVPDVACLISVCVPNQHSSSGRLMSILVIADVLDDVLLPSTHNTSPRHDSFRHSPTRTFTCWCQGYQLKEAVKSATLASVDKVLVADAAASGRSRWQRTLQRVVLSLSKSGYSHLLFGANSFGKNVAPRVAAKLRCRAVLRHCCR